MGPSDVEAEVLLEGGSAEDQAPHARTAGGLGGQATGRRQARVAATIAAGLSAAALMAFLGQRAVADANADASRSEVQLSSSSCTLGRANCNETTCCSGPGMQCYEQDAGYAQCRISCVPGPDPTHWDGKMWSCRELGNRTAGEDICGKAFQDCTTSHCCSEPGFQCFAKNESYAACKSECVAGGPDLSDSDAQPWSCEKLGSPALSVQPWVEGQCSKGLDNCVGTMCCKIPGQQCSLQNDYYGNCMTACVGVGDGDPWSCKPLGPRTPNDPIKGGPLAPWVLETCALANEGCSKSKCCIGMDMQCYEKNEDWAQCRQSCKAGPHADDGNETWSCKPLGPRALGVSTKGFPSLYCFALLRTVGYEVGLVKDQLAHRAGVFDCDDFSLMTADDSITLGDGPRGPVKTIQFQGAPVVTSQDGTAGNSKLFVNAWDAVVAAGIWRNHSWTVKVDPDAVMIPDRLRWHLAPHTGKNVFVLNCNKFPGPNYPMVYGALEVFSNAAIQAWASRGHDCYAPNTYGEDYYMTRCMDFLGVGRVLDEQVLGDNLCMGADCNNGWIAAFHPYKDEASWQKCYDTAMGTPITV